MKIALISDFHLGFGKGTERFEESFENAKKAMEISLSQGAECILVLGDVFDSEIPSQETWHNAFKIFAPIKSTEPDCKITRIKKEQKETIECTHIPIIAIHGTHEYRGKGFKNAVEVLESAGFLIHLHAATAIIEKQGEKIAVHGLGGIPEKHALAGLQAWNPKAEQGAVNIMLLHQSIKEFLPFEDEMIASISLSDLPSGFDLIADGHLHWNGVEEIKGGKFLLTGSTIITQMKKLESENQKAISIFNTKSRTLDFVKLPGQRKLFYEKIVFKEANQEQILKTVENKLEGFLSGSFEKKPLVRLKLVGSLTKGITSADINLSEIEKRFSEKAILSVSKEFDSESFKAKISQLREMQKEKKSVSAMGLEVLEKNLEEAGFGKKINAKQLLDLLEQGEGEKAMEILLIEN
jgi:DNA repair exonuclease SbcCD nuclease subunit